METLDSRLCLLRSLNPEERLAALVATIDSCEESARARVAVELVELAVALPDPNVPRRQGLLVRLRSKVVIASEPLADRALRAVAERWCLLPDELRRAVVPMVVGRWSRVVAGVSVGSIERARRSAVLLAEDSQDVGLAEVCVALLHDPEVSIAVAAGRSLVRIVEQAARSDADARSALDPLVLKAISEIGTHRCRGAAVAAIIMLTPAALRASAGARGPLAAWFIGPETEGHAALRNALRADRSTFSAGRAWEWLKVPRFVSAAGERLGALRECGEFAPLLACAHLIAHPRRRQEWNSLRASGRATPLPVADQTRTLDVGAQRSVAVLAGAAGGNAAERDALLGWMLGAEDAGVRMAAARVAGPTGVVDYCFDHDPRVALGAFLLWSAVGEHGHDEKVLGRIGARTSPPRQRWLKKLSRSPHAIVRGLARDEAHSTDWLEVGSAGGRATARAMLLNDREGTIEHLRRAIIGTDGDSGSDRAEQVRAILLARRLELAVELAGELERVIRSKSSDQGARAQATAVQALAGVRSAAAEACLRECLEHEDARVRANAIEAIGRRVMTSGFGSIMSRALLIERKSDANHRVRGNALRAWIQTERAMDHLSDRDGEGDGNRAGTLDGVIEVKPRSDVDRAHSEGLLSMLTDDRPMHRLAGAWAANRCMAQGGGPGHTAARWADVAARLSRLAREDDDLRVRLRAELCVARHNAEGKRSAIRSPSERRENE